MTPSRVSLLIAGLCLIILTNLITLSVVAYNRSGEPESRLTLSERELVHSNEFQNDSGLSVKIRWRTLTNDTSVENPIPNRIPESGIDVPWLDNAKLITLGFAPQSHVRDAEFIDKSLPRKVYLVLELNGAVYQHVLQKAKDLLTQEEALKLTNPDNDEIARRAKSAQEKLELESNKSSRLFVVDAGLNAAQLRFAYPDRERFAIVQGEIQANFIKADKAEQKRVGSVTSVFAEQIYVPFAFRSLIKRQKNEATDRAQPSMLHRELVVVFGRRLEPWIIAAKQY